MNKDVIILILVFVLIFGAAKVFSNSGTQTPIAQNSIAVTTDAPSVSPTTSFALKQQCSDDANEYVSHVNSLHVMNATYNVEDSVYNNQLNTCLADLTSITTLADGQILMGHQIVDTLNNKVMAQFMEDVKYDFEDFTPDKGCGTLPENKCKVTPNDYFNYADSVGLHPVL